VDSGIDFYFPLIMHQNHVKSCFRERAENFAEAFTVFEIVYAHHQTFELKLSIISGF
jgi:hypothetical protein